MRGLTVQADKWVCGRVKPPGRGVIVYVARSAGFTELAKWEWPTKLYIQAAPVKGPIVELGGYRATFRIVGFDETGPDPWSKEVDVDLSAEKIVTFNGGKLVVIVDGPGELGPDGGSDEADPGPVAPAGEEGAGDARDGEAEEGRDIIGGLSRPGEGEGTTEEVVRILPAPRVRTHRWLHIRPVFDEKVVEKYKEDFRLNDCVSFDFVEPLARSAGEQLSVEAMDVDTVVERSRGRRTAFLAEYEGLIVGGSDFARQGLTKMDCMYPQILRYVNRELEWRGAVIWLHESLGASGDWTDVHTQLGMWKHEGGGCAPPNYTQAHWLVGADHPLRSRPFPMPDGSFAVAETHEGFRLSGPAGSGGGVELCAKLEGGGRYLVVRHPWAYLELGHGPRTKRVLGADGIVMAHAGQITPDEERLIVNLMCYLRRD